LGNGAGSLILGMLFSVRIFGVCKLVLFRVVELCGVSFSFLLGAVGVEPAVPANWVVTCGTIGCCARTRWATILSWWRRSGNAVRTAERF